MNPRSAPRSRRDPKRTGEAKATCLSRSLGVFTLTPVVTDRSSYSRPWVESKPRRGALGQQGATLQATHLTLRQPSRYGGGDTPLTSHLPTLGTYPSQTVEIRTLRPAVTRFWLTLCTFSTGMVEIGVERLTASLWLACSVVSDERWHARCCRSRTRVGLAALVAWLTTAECAP